MDLGYTRIINILSLINKKVALNLIKVLFIVNQSQDLELIANSS